MNIAYIHASKYGNGATVAEEARRQATAAGATVTVHHIHDLDPTALPAADLYVFSSPGRWGKPLGAMRRFAKRVTLPAGTPYALLTTEIAPRPDTTTGQAPTPEEQATRQQVRPVLNQLLQAAGLHQVTEQVVLVTAIKGPLEDGWQSKIGPFVHDILQTRRPERETDVSTT